MRDSWRPFGTCRTTGFRSAPRSPSGWTLGAVSAQMPSTAIDPVRPDTSQALPLVQISLKSSSSIRTGPTGDKEAYLLVVDRDGVAKACTQKTYPLRVALQMAWAITLPIYTGRGGTLIAEVQEESMRKLQGAPQLPEL